MVNPVVKVGVVLFFLIAMPIFSQASIVIPMHCKKYIDELFEERYSKDDFPVAEKCVVAKESLYRFRSLPKKNIYGSCKAYEVYIYSRGEVKERVLLSREKPNGDCDTEYERYISFDKDREGQEKIFSDIWLSLNDAAGAREFSLNNLSFFNRFFSTSTKAFLRAIKSCKKTLNCVDFNSMYQEGDFWKVLLSVNEKTWVLSLGYDSEQISIYSISDL